MYAFSEVELIDHLSKLSTPAMVAFALAAATRQLPVLEHVTRDSPSAAAGTPRKVASTLWSALGPSAIGTTNWGTLLDETLSLLPEEGDFSSRAGALADDAMASLAYALRCQIKPSAQEAAWAARRAYEAADQAAIWLSNVTPGTPHAEALLLAHPVVQRELQRQQMDIQYLNQGDLMAVQSYAVSSALLTRDELRALLG